VSRSVVSDLKQTAACRRADENLLHAVSRVTELQNTLIEQNAAVCHVVTMLRGYG
jgi:hypothetical protein